MTPRERQCLAAISALTVDGVSPTYREIADAMGLKSKSNVHRFVSDLVRQGYISRRPHRENSLRVIPPLESAIRRLIDENGADVVAAEFERQRGRG